MRGVFAGNGPLQFALSLNYSHRLFEISAMCMSLSMEKEQSNFGNNENFQGCSTWMLVLKQWMSTSLSFAVPGQKSASKWNSIDRRAVILSGIDHCSSILIQKKKELASSIGLPNFASEGANWTVSFPENPTLKVNTRSAYGQSSSK